MILSVLQAERLGARERDLVQVLAIRDLGSFYRIVRMIFASDMESILVRRLTADLGLTGEQQGELERLLDDEQEAVTLDAVRRHGQETLYAALDLPRADRAAFVRLLSEERERVRRGFDGAYLRLVGAERLPMINEHLRSRYIELHRNTGDRSVSIAGVGSPDFLDALEVGQETERLRSEEVKGIRGVGQ